MTYELFGITWSIVGAPLYLLVFLSLLWMVWWRAYKRKKIVVLLVHKKWQARLMRNFSSTRNLFKACLYLLGLVLLFLALLRPQWGLKDEVVPQDGRDLFIALDISRSMLAQDVKPNRLEFAKEKIRTLFKKLSCERVGLIVFSGSAFVQCPLTKDYSAFHMFLDTLDVETISSGTTALDRAIEKALSAFGPMSDRTYKILVLFTDGEDFSSNLASIKKRALSAGMNIFTMGVGTPEGAPIPIVNEHGMQVGVQKDAKGSVVISSLNEGILHALSRETGGQYGRLVENETDIDFLVQAVKRYEKQQFDEKKLQQQKERYYYFLAGSFFCFLLEWIL